MSVERTMAASPHALSRPVALPLGMSLVREVVTSTTKVGGTTTIKTDTRPVTTSQLRHDPVAAAAATNATTIARWAKDRGLASVTDVLRGAQITLTGAMHDGAWSDLRFAPPRKLTRFHYARSPETWGHEVAHRVLNAFANIPAPADHLRDDHKLLELEEGIADVFGVAYARSIGSTPALADFVMSDELDFRTNDPVMLRDLAAFPGLTLDDMLSTSSKSPRHRYTWGRPLGAAYVELVERLGDGRAGTLVFDAVTRHLRDVLAGEPATFASRNAPYRESRPERVREQYEWLHQAFRAAAGEDAAARSAVDASFGRILGSTTADR